MFQGHEFKKLHEKRLKLFHPQPNLIRVSYMFTHALQIFQATQKYLLRCKREASYIYNTSGTSKAIAGRESAQI